MAGRHDKAGDDPTASRLALTGPIAVRGLSRGVRGALRPGRESRHRASDDAEQAGLAEEDLAAGDSVKSNGAAVLQPADRPGDLDSGERGGPIEGEGHPVAEQRPGGDPDEEVGSPDTVGPAADEVSKEDSEAGADQDVADGSAFLIDRAESESESGGDRFDPGPRPLRSRFGREGAAIAVLVVLAIVCAGLITAVVIKTRNDAAVAAREAADYTPPPLSSSAATDRPLVAVVGDESAIRGATGVSESKRWPALLGAALGGDVSVDAAAGAGYLSKGATGGTFVQMARDVPTDADVVVFVGGAADADSTSLDLAKAATEAYSTAANKATGSVVIAIGPLFVPSAADAADLAAMRTTLRSSARIADIRWVDPVGSKWLKDVDRTGDLSTSVEQSIAKRMAAVVRPAAD